MASEKNAMTPHDDELVIHQHYHAPTDVKLHHDKVALEAIGGFEKDLPTRYYLSLDFLGTLVATCLAQISGYLGWVLPANTLGLISTQLGVTSNLIWLAVSWQIGLAVGFLWVGRLSDIFGRRWFFTSACVVGLIGNIVAASARRINMLIAANCLNGIAAGPQLSFSVVLGELVPNKRRGIYNSIVLSTSVPFAVFGPPIARAFFEHTALTFRWSYILGLCSSPAWPSMAVILMMSQSIVNAIAILLYFFLYHPPAYEKLHVGGKSKFKQLATFDWVGFTFFTAGMTIFLIALNWGGSVYSWRSGQVLCTFFAGIAVFVLFCVWEAYCRLEYKLMPLELFRNIKYDAIVVVGCTACMPYYAFTVIWPTLAGALWTSSIERIGWLSCAVGGGYVLGQIFGGIGVRYLPRVKYQMTVAAVLMTAFFAAIASANPSSEGRTTVFFLIGMVGGGYIENVVLSIMALVWEPDDIGLASGVLCAIRTAGGAIATAMYSSILATEATKYLPEYVGPAALAAGLPESSPPALLAGVSTQSFKNVPGVSAAVLQVIADPIKHAYTLSFRTVFLCTLPFGVITIVAAILCPNVEDYMTDQVARKLQGGRHGAGAVDAYVSRE